MRREYLHYPQNEQEPNPSIQRNDPRVVDRIGGFFGLTPDQSQTAYTVAKRATQVIGTVGILWGVSNASFSTGVRRRMLARDNNQCTVCGSTEHLEAAHYNHDKTNPNYNNPENGRILCQRHHLEDHINRQGDPQIGLTVAGNEWAIGRLAQRVITNYGVEGLKFTE